MSNILVIGSGGREHALAWRLSQSPKVGTVYTAPGNGGTKNNIDIPIDDFDAIIDFAKRNKCLVIVGPEAPLSQGIVDACESVNLPVFGPTKQASQLESSKIWAKKFMVQNNIPTADFEVFVDSEEAKKYVKDVPYNVVIKADGLAAGKGVIVCSNKEQAYNAIDDMLNKKAFGNAGDKIIIEQRIEGGVEASCISMCDGITSIPMATSQDHKRVFDGDAGPNTGGMGAYSPTPTITKQLQHTIQNDIIQKTVDAMRSNGIPFTGFLYAGIMIKDGKPYVLEFNVRMGDPECQPVMMRMNFDLYDYLLACTQSRLKDMPSPLWLEKSAVCVVLASSGYPNSYKTGEVISGLDYEDEDTLHNSKVAIFHAGTKRQKSKKADNDNNKNNSSVVITSGGRVLGVTALGDSLQDAVSTAYKAVDKITWPSKYYRKDIGCK